MFSAREHLKQRLENLNTKITSNLDFDFSSVSKRIETMEEFDQQIMQEFVSGKKLYYRGERINDPERRLLPTMLRNSRELFKDNDLGILHIDGQFLFDYYSSLGDFVEVFSCTMGKVDVDHLYEICAFAQHYCNFSPLIDFTKSVYPSLSFALKDRDKFDDDIVLYVLELKNDEDYTNNIETANEWIRDLNIYCGHFDEFEVKKAVRDVIKNKRHLEMSEDFKSHLEHINTISEPRAKLIDVPTNTRMKFQQGVFLLLTDFLLFNVTYFTKSIREQFSITKYIINKDICDDILDVINRDAPWYSYKYLTDVSGAFNEAMEKRIK